jgi:hypothetical protein
MDSEVLCGTQVKDSNLLKTKSLNYCNVAEDMFPGSGISLVVSCLCLRFDKIYI